MNENEFDPGLVAQIDALEPPKLYQVIYRTFNGLRTGEPQYRVSTPKNLLQDTVQHVEYEGMTGHVSILGQLSLREELEASS